MELERNLTVLLNQASGGDHEAEEAVFSLLYDELRGHASRLLRAKPSADLETTGLVHEAYLKLFRGKELRWSDRKHFYGWAVRTMERILIDHWRSHHSQRRAMEGVRVPLDRLVQRVESSLGLVPDVLEALDALEAEDATAALVARLRYWAGLTMAEIAAAIGVPKRSVEREWAFAQMHIARSLSA